MESSIMVYGLFVHSCVKHHQVIVLHHLGHLRRQLKLASAYSHAVKIMLRFVKRSSRLAGKLLCKSNWL